ncbi:MULTISPECIES: DUF4267 domain-containing protein [Catenuloplanes]|uniref:DUF4267 domain-containing protein n=1 Tax=Catenuloplanes niger TaxID=587534 RepID=A0AAE3ZU16_9ACTN|nr:DUF4267 domain-containing protein [Catenuloplanes niger]MDR7326074.1 hypothetical protein [Catenuloplanes niger]
MLTVVAYGLAVLLNVFIIVIGVRFLAAPVAAAAGYGVPADPRAAGAYLSVKGVRDITVGLIGLALLTFAGAPAAAWFMLVVVLVPLGDTLIVLRHGGTRATAFGVHLSTAVIVAISASLLFTQ